MGFPLQPIRFAESKPFPYAVCDIEAHKWINFKAIGFYDGENYKMFQSLSEFFDYLVFQHAVYGKGVFPNKKGNIKFKIFAHFGGKYDFNFLLKELIMELDDSWTVGDIIPRGSGMLCFDAFYKNITVSFYDSSALLPFGLARLTQAFDVPTKKGSFDFESWDGKVTEELLAYLKDDCVGLYQVLKSFYSWPLIKFSGPAVTMASQSLKVFRSFLKEELYPPSNSADEFVRKSYFGGRVEIFKPHFERAKKGKPLMAFDVNSLYPAVMVENEFPGNFDRFSFRYDAKKMGFFEAEVEVPKDMYCPPLGLVFDVPTKTEEWKKGVKKEKVHLSSKFIFPTGRFSGIWSIVELEYAKSVGVTVIKTGRGCYFKSAGFLFKDYIETLYQLRMEAKAKGDGVTDVMTKLLMNSLYGRFGLNLDRELLEIDTGQAGVTPDLELKKGKKYFRLCRKETKISAFTNVAISAWVTSLSRIKMHQFYVKCGKNLWYTDTDSLYTTEKFTDSKELGFLKWEGDIKSACFLLPKTYALESYNDKQEIMKKLVMKGFDKKKVAQFSVHDFMTALEGDMKLLTTEQPEKFCTFRTAMRKGEFVAMMEKTTRTLKTRYDKRKLVKVGDTYDTEPLHIEDGRVVNL